MIRKRFMKKEGFKGWEKSRIEAAKGKGEEAWRGG